MPNPCRISALLLQALASLVNAQDLRPAPLSGIVLDSAGRTVPGAAVTLITGHGEARRITTGADGFFLFPQLEQGDYRVEAAAAGFATASSQVEYRGIPLHMRLSLATETLQTRMTVTATMDNPAEPMHQDITDRQIDRLPNTSLSSPFSSLVTATSPGVAADSNGSFHPLGDHAEASFELDGQPITDQQSRAFSSQISLNALDSAEVREGAPAADVGDKTSMVILAHTKSGLDQTVPRGNISVTRGSFHTSSASASLAAGSATFGSFTALDAIRSGRFLDTPEIVPLHANGNGGNLMERLDYKANAQTAFQLNLSASSSWFQTPNTWDQQALGQNQRQTVTSFNIAPQSTHVFDAHHFIRTNLWVRQDRIRYYPSGNVYSDTPAWLQQTRRLTNAGIRSTYAYNRGRHNITAGVELRDTFLSEEFATGLTDPAWNSPCLRSDGTDSPDPALRASSQCAASGLRTNPDFLPGLLAIDLTRGGQIYSFRGSTTIGQGASFVQDDIHLGNFTLTAGLRFDLYRGLARNHALQPRTGVAYHSSLLHTGFHVDYSRIMITPYNENLIVASSNGPGSVSSSLGAGESAVLNTGGRNQFNTGFETPTRHFQIAGEYFWKFTRGAYDFDVLLNSPLTFPTQFRKSKIDGGMIRANLNPLRGFSGFVTASHVRSRLFGPETGGISFSAPYSNVARPDHDQGLAANLNIHYQHGRRGPWVNADWRYDGGLVAVAVPDIASALRLSGDEQQQIGLHCDLLFATVNAPLRSCPGMVSATRIRIPPPGAENDDTRPPRIAVRNTIDLAVGMDDLFHRDEGHVGIRVEIVNLTNVPGLYNFLSTFAGTHFISPRAVTIGLRYSF
ncbi:MAG TPA: TonB-dependent receptor [Bryobacteraceae bacterium]|jgi:hypothetical protein